MAISKDDVEGRCQECGCLIRKGRGIKGTVQKPKTEGEKRLYCSQKCKEKNPQAGNQARFG